MHAGIIGAGLSGLACARVLDRAGVRVTVIDEGPTPGGRMCARELGGGVRADHGTRSFFVHDKRFAAQVEDWKRRGLVATWTPELASIHEPGKAVRGRFRSARHVGTPTMHAPARDLADGLTGGVEFRPGCRAVSIHRAAADGWDMQEEGGRVSRFDAVVLAIPSPRAATLLGEIPHLHALASAVPMTPVWATMVVFRERLPIAFDAANISIGARHAHAGVLAWMSRESSKPGRAPDECWVLHAGEQWSADHRGADADEVGRHMVEAMFAAAGVEPVEPVEIGTHLWRHAFPVAPLCDGCLYDEPLAVGACGDWCMGSRVEGAYLSGLAMAGRLLGERSDFLEPCMPGNQQHR